MLERNERPASPKVRCFAGHLSALSEAREFVRQLGVDSRVPDAIRDELVLAVSEACSNAVDHSGTLLVYVSWQVHEQRIEVQVKDDGIFRRQISIPKDEGGGLGIRLMMSLVDEFGISHGTAESPGTLVRLQKSIPRDATPSGLEARSAS